MSCKGSYWLFLKVKITITSILSYSCNDFSNVMLRHIQWFEAADLIVKGMEGAIAAKTVTYDFERLMEGAKLLKYSEFGDAIIKKM